MSYFELTNKLLDAQSSNATGKFQILGKLKGGSKGVSIDIYQGKVVKIRAGNVSGPQAAKLLIAMIIQRVVFIKSGSIEPTPEKNTPDTNSLLRMISDSGKSITINRIINITNNALNPSMGSASVKFVDDVAARFPPDEDESLFVIKCKKAAARVIGEGKSNKIFDSYVAAERAKYKRSVSDKISKKSNGNDIGGNTIGSSSKGIPDDVIIEMTIDALSKVMGPGAKKIINGIAANYPPAENKRQFLNKCRLTATNLVGANIADKIIDSLQRKTS